MLAIYCIKCLTYIFSLNPYNISMRPVLVSKSYRWENWGTDWLRKLKVTQLISVHTEIWILVFLATRFMHQPQGYPYTLFGLAIMGFCLYICTNSLILMEATRLAFIDFWEQQRFCFADIFHLSDNENIF